MTPPITWPGIAHAQKYAQAASIKLEYHERKRTPNSVHVLLGHLCRQMYHETIIAKDEVDGPADDAEILQRIMEGPNLIETVVNYSEPALSQMYDELVTVL